ncbi:hypothetical protein AB4369_26135, partial [Vibrio sp. 10N.261.49.A5]
SYTHHSQYLTKLTLSGNNDANIEINEHDNRVTGNAGVNTVIAHGPKSEYQIHDLGNGKFQLNDTVVSRDGLNVLSSIEKVQFTDQL